jgi:quercetin dioxygenase-like cupin family protein
MEKMKLVDVPFGVMDWASLPAEEHKGEAGTSFWRTVERGGLRVRMIEYSPGFRSDHWCARGHVLLVLDGELALILRGGEEFVLRPGMSFAAGDDDGNPHMVRSMPGAKAFVVD